MRDEDIVEEEMLKYPPPMFRIKCINLEENELVEHSGNSKVLTYLIAVFRIKV